MPDDEGLLALLRATLGHPTGPGVVLHALGSVPGALFDPGRAKAVFRGAVPASLTLGPWRFTIGPYGTVLCEHVVNGVRIFRDELSAVGAADTVAGAVRSHVERFGAQALDAVAVALSSVAEAQGSL